MIADHSYSELDVYWYVHRHLHVYINIMDIYIDIAESSSLLAAAAPGLGPWVTARSLPPAFHRLQGWSELLRIKKGY